LLDFTNATHGESDDTKIEKLKTLYLARA